MLKHKQSSILEAFANIAHIDSDTNLPPPLHVETENEEEFGALFIFNEKDDPSVPYIGYSHKKRCCVQIGIRYPHAMCGTHRMHLYDLHHVFCVVYVAVAELFFYNASCVTIFDI